MSANDPHRLFAHLVRFSRELRQAGLPVTPAQTVTLAQALEQVSLTDPRLFFYASRTALVTRKDDWHRFEKLFRQFWHNLGFQDFPAQLDDPPPPKPQAKPADATSQQDSGSQQENPEVITDRSQTYSQLEVLRHKRFDHMSQEEMAQAKLLLRRFRLQVAPRQTRRLEAQPAGSRLHMRRSLRQSLKHQGELVRLHWQGPRVKPRPIVAIADVSGSMERYARLLLHFLHAFAQQSSHGKQRVESFVFGTRLTRITRQLQKRSVDQALQEVGQQVKDWSGGTRIGEALHAFHRQWAKRVLGGGAVVLLISDGWDQGDPTVLAHEMERLQKSCYRLIWLNPLIGTPGYQPLTRGLQAALPFTDDFLSVMNLHSIEQLAHALQNIRSRSTPRRSGQPSARQAP